MDTIDFLNTSHSMAEKIAGIFLVVFSIPIIFLLITKSDLEFGIYFILSITFLTMVSYGLHMLTYQKTCLFDSVKKQLVIDRRIFLFPFIKIYPYSEISKVLGEMRISMESDSSSHDDVRMSSRKLKVNYSGYMKYQDRWLQICIDESKSIVANALKEFSKITGARLSLKLDREETGKHKDSTLKIVAWSIFFVTILINVIFIIAMKK
ncbi:MAG: hypothetical protein KUG73_13205 [Pseudomonadales bacterium]|nr:hypothetical protein [Pseudomonadales bacterium]